MHTPVFELLLLSLRSDDDVAAGRAANIIARGGVLWDDLIRSAAMHCIRPQLSGLLTRLPSGTVPEGLIAGLQDECRTIALNQVNYVAEFFRVRDLLAGEGIKIIPFKGFWLAHEAYGNIADRESSDVDVLTDPASLERIRKLMTQAGYVEEETYRGLTMHEITRRFREYNYEKVIDGQNVFHIEFHWGICPPGYGMAVSVSDLSDHITAGTFQGRSLEVLTPAAQMLLSLLHHGGKDRFVLLKQVNDIAMLIRNGGETDWVWLVRAMRRYSAEPLLYTALNLASRVTGVQLPAGLDRQVNSAFIRRLADNRMKVIALPLHRRNTPVFNLGNWYFRMRSRTGFATRLKLTAATTRALLSGRRENE